MNKFISIGLAVVLLAISCETFSQVKTPEFRKTKTGLQYRYISNVPGRNAAVKDYMEFHILQTVNDSVLFDSRKLNGDLPVPYQLQPPQYKGDISEGFMMMSAGDVAEFLLPVDTLLNRGQMFPPFVEKGKNLFVKFHVEMVVVRTAKEHKDFTVKAAAKQKRIDDSLIRYYLKINQVKASKTATGLYYRITDTGAGAKAVNGDSVSMNYTGMLLDGTVFDSNVDSAFMHVQPFWFILGQQNVISGWDEGITYLRKGARATLYVPSGLAYGPQARGGKIPANAIMIFEVELVDLVRRK